MKHQPATPLPWNANGDDRAAIYKQWGNAGMQQRVATMETAPASEAQPNAAYIAHAANAYPRLVGRILNNLLAHSLADNDSEQGEIRCTCQQCGANRALLRELGEE